LTVEPDNPISISIPIPISISISVMRDAAYRPDLSLYISAVALRPKG